MSEQFKKAVSYIIENKQIKTVFQPIISLRDGSILGHEALSRITCESEIENTEMLFEIAGQHNRLWELELLCRTTALEAAYKFMIPPYSKKLFLNVNPNIMHDEAFKKGFTKGFLKHYDITPQNVIFEITERNVITDIDGFTSTVDHYKSQDFKIAIDDAGSGYSGLNLISDVNPHYIKLDMKLIRDVNNDSLKFALVKGMVEFSKVSNTYLIAEGIETYAELETLINIGVQYGQGYFIQMPNQEVLEIRDEILSVIKKLNQKKNSINNNTITNIYIKNLCTFTDVVHPNEKVSNVYDIFKQDSNHFGLCVVADGVPIGIVTQEKLALKLSGRYGYTLYQNKTISEIMDKNFLSVDYKTPISEVSSIAMSRPINKLYDFIVVTENEKYIGTVTIKNLLQKTTEIEVSTAKHQNPLSGLPGNLIIEQMLAQCLACTEEYSIAYIDIDNFKAYNDCYGFENGDLIIKLLANILRNYFPIEQFVGHIGGDDFIVILNKCVNDNYFIDVVKEFENKVLKFYNKTDISNGYITANNRRGELEKFPLITITYVLANNNTHNFSNIFELTEYLAKMKKNAKQSKYS
ncbi:MAG: GGDEF domain-containing protein [Sedimentibacter sp.]|uniref:GGDEF domain-containing protein n=1 Tax=Sedimentibacter sp. TaxID=1960295 RepID=UPI00298262E0|nr:GGDEF domain-containing protein [Sedimentibacter sp.]MDW5298765.1 GGDEF domain-containing protein [Sedimentibacter sp.]